MKLPQYPSNDDTASDRQPARTGNGAAVAGIVVIGVLVAVVMLVHLLGVVGPGAH